MSLEFDYMHLWNANFYVISHLSRVHSNEYEMASNFRTRLVKNQR